MVRRVVFLLAVMVVGFLSYRAVEAQATALSTIASTDYDRNGKADLTVFRPGEGRFYVEQAPNFNTAFAIDSASATARTDFILPPNDYNADGAVDSALYRPTTVGSAALAGTWTITLGPTFNTSTSVVWGGATGDKPLPADWDGNGSVDVAVYRPAERKLYVLQGPNFNSAFTIGPFGLPGDSPEPADWDGDGKTDFAVWRPSERRIYVLQAGSAAAPFSTAFAFNFGTATQTLLAGDYDGDGRIDLAGFTATPQANNWLFIQGGTNFSTMFALTWGFTGDIPCPGDWDGDGKLDVAVYRPAEGRFYVLQQGASGSSKYSTAFSNAWGITTDVPISARNPQPQQNATNTALATF